MNKKIIYIAHPISGNIEANLSDLRRIIKKLNFRYREIVFCAPYYGDCVSLNDKVLMERSRGMYNNKNLILTGLFDELHLTGDIISNGMKEEIKLFADLGKPVFNFIGKL